MPPWFILGGGAVLLYLLTTLRKQVGGGKGDAGGNGAGDADALGSGAAEGEYVIPGEFNYLPGYAQYQSGESGGTADTGFAESFEAADTAPAFSPVADRSSDVRDYSRTARDPVPSSGSYGSPTIGGGTVGEAAPNVTLGGGTGTSSKKPLLME